MTCQLALYDAPISSTSVSAQSSFRGNKTIIRSRQIQKPGVGNDILSFSLCCNAHCTAPHLNKSLSQSLKQVTLDLSSTIDQAKNAIEGLDTPEHLELLI